MIQPPGEFREQRLGEVRFINYTQLPNVTQITFITPLILSSFSIISSFHALKLYHWYVLTLLWLIFSRFTYHIWQIHSFSHFGFIKGVRVTFDRVCSVCSILRLMQSIPVDNVKVFPPSTTPQIELKQSWLTHPQGWHTIQAEEKDELLGTEILILKNVLIY